MRALISFMYIAASSVYKSKTVQIQPADDLEDCNEWLVWVATLIGTLLYAHPYSVQSPALKDCYQSQLYQDSSPTPPDAQAADHLSPSSNMGAEQQSMSQAGQHEHTQINGSPLDQQSSCAACDPHPPSDPHLLGDPHPPGSPHPPDSPNPSGLLVVPDSQQNETTPDEEAYGPASPRQLISNVAFMATAEQQKAESLSQMDVDVWWATPSQPVWADIETVALRALVTLDWAMQCKPDSVKMLTKLVYALLAGHVMDRQLNMTAVLKFGLPAVLGALSYTQPHPSEPRVVTTVRLRHLACLFLRRLASDRRAFQEIFGRPAHEERNEVERLKAYPAVESLWSLLRRMMCFHILMLEFLCLCDS